MNLKGTRICYACLLGLGNIIEKIYLFFIILINVFPSEIADKLVYNLSYKAQVHPHFMICEDFKFCLGSSINCVVDIQGSSVTAGLKRLSVQTAERVVVSRQTLLLLRIIKKRKKTIHGSFFDYRTGMKQKRMPQILAQRKAWKT